MYLLLSFFVFLISTFLFQKASGSLSLKFVNISSYTYYTFIIWIFIGSILVLYRISNFESILPDDQDIRIMGWVLIMYMMIATPLSMILINMFTSFKPKKNLINYYESILKPVFNFKDDTFKLSLYLIAGAASLNLIFNFVSNIDSIPFFNKFFSDQLFGSMELYKQRNSTRMYPSGSIFMPIISALIPLASYVSFSYVISYGKKIDKFFFIFFCIVSIYMQVFDLSKARIFFYMISLIIVYQFSGNSINYRTYFIFFLFGVFGIGLTYVFFMGQILDGFAIKEILSIGANAIFGRVFVGQIAGFYECLNVFPTDHPFLGFSSTARYVHEVFELEFNPDYGIILRVLMKTNEQIAVSGMGHYTTFFMGEAYANFGYIGVIVAPWLVGVNVQIINIFFLRIKKSPLTISLYTSIILALPLLTYFQAFYYPMWVLQILFRIFLVIGIAIIIRGATQYSLNSTSINKI